MQARSREKVTEAAIRLFHARGFSATSVREIAATAGVNVALISYHFGGKKGLMEHLMTSFYERYIAIVEEGYKNLENASATECLLQVVSDLLTFQQQNVALSRFVHREVTFDTTLVRELMSTYLMKEKYCFTEIFKTGIKRREFRSCPVDLFVLQLREMLLLPFLHPQYIRELFHLAPQEEYFRKRYEKYVAEWILSSVCSGSERKKAVREA